MVKSIGSKAPIAPIREQKKKVETEKPSEKTIEAPKTPQKVQEEAPALANGTDALAEMNKVALNSKKTPIPAKTAPESTETTTVDAKTDVPTEDKAVTTSPAEETTTVDAKTDVPTEDKAVTTPPAEETTTVDAKTDVPTEDKAVTTPPAEETTTVDAKTDVPTEDKAVTTPKNFNVAVIDDFTNVDYGIKTHGDKVSTFLEAGIESSGNTVTIEKIDATDPETGTLSWNGINDALKEVDRKNEQEGVKYDAVNMSIAVNLNEEDLNNLFTGTDVGPLNIGPDGNVGNDDVQEKMRSAIINAPANTELGSYKDSILAIEDVAAGATDSPDDDIPVYISAGNQGNQYEPDYKGQYNIYSVARGTTSVGSQFEELGFANNTDIQRKEESFYFYDDTIGGWDTNLDGQAEIKGNPFGNGSENDETVIFGTSFGSPDALATDLAKGVAGDTAAGPAAENLASGQTLEAKTIHDNLSQDETLTDSSITAKNKYGTNDQSVNGYDNTISANNKYGNNSLTADGMKNNTDQQNVNGNNDLIYTGSDSTLYAKTSSGTNTQTVSGDFNTTTAKNEHGENTQVTDGYGQIVQAKNNNGNNNQVHNSVLGDLSAVTKHGNNDQSLSGDYNILHAKNMYGENTQTADGTGNYVETINKAGNNTQVFNGTGSVLNAENKRGDNTQEIYNDLNSAFATNSTGNNAQTAGKYSALTATNKQGENSQFADEGSTLEATNNKGANAQISGDLSTLTATNDKGDNTQMAGSFSLLTSETKKGNTFQMAGEGSVLDAKSDKGMIYQAAGDGSYMSASGNSIQEGDAGSQTFVKEGNGDGLINGYGGEDTIFATASDKKSTISIDTGDATGAASDDSVTLMLSESSKSTINVLDGTSLLGDDNDTLDVYYSISDASKADSYSAKQDLDDLGNFIAYYENENMVQKIYANGMENQNAYLNYTDEAGENIYKNLLAPLF